jgi:hypothetical protein
MTIRFTLAARVVLLPCALILIATPRTVLAGPIVFTGVVVNDGSCTPYVDCVVDPLSPNDADPGDIATSGTGFVEISGTFGGALLSAAADADAGLLRTIASASYDLADPGYRIAAASAIVADWLTITAPGVADGTSGVLDVSVTLDGTITKSGTADAGTFVGVLWGGTAPLEGQDFQAFTTSTSASDVFTIGVPFTFGDRFLLTLWLFSTAGTIGVCDELTPTACPETEGTTPYLASGVGASSADFFNTLVLSGLVPKIGGIPVANPVFTADSGAQYTVNGVVPEPGTLLLLGTGVTFLLARRRNNRSC